MLVHFIGGPAHGRSEAIQNPHALYRMAELKASNVFGPRGEWPPPTVPFEEHTYKIIHRTPRYAIAKCEPSKVRVRILIELEVDAYDSDAYFALHQFVKEVRVDSQDDVRCVEAALHCADKATLTLDTEVEGPKDAIALQLAAEKVQHYLDANLPASSRCRVRHTAADTID